MRKKRIRKSWKKLTKEVEKNIILDFDNGRAYNKFRRIMRAYKIPIGQLCKIIRKDSARKIKYQL